MTMPGVIPYPRELSAVYRAKGYWDDRLLIEHYEDAFTAFADRVALIDDSSSWTYAQLSQRSLLLARVLLDLGLQPGDRVVVQLPNTATFAFFYLALQRLGVIPIMALPSHRFREIEQLCGYPARWPWRRRRARRTPTSQTFSAEFPKVSHRSGGILVSAKKPRPTCLTSRG